MQIGSLPWGVSASAGACVPAQRYRSSEGLAAPAACARHIISAGTCTSCRRSQPRCAATAPTRQFQAVRSQLQSLCLRLLAAQPHQPATARSRSCALLITAVRKPAAQVKQRKSGEEAASPQRLSKVLAAAGIASRRAAEELIFAGNVKLNGKVVTVPQTLAHPQQDKIEVNGKVVTAQPQRKFYFAVNKPKGYACTSSAPEGEGGGGRLVLDLLEPWLARFRKEHLRGTLPPRLYTVGRLDVASVGLLFVSNDGAWAQKVMHPSSGLTKEYIATVDRPATRKQMEELALGGEVDGAQVQPVAVGIDNSDPGNNNRKIRIVVSEGRNREVRTLLANVGLTVTFLKRVRIGGYRLPKDLSLGGMRPLKPNEIRRVLDKGAELL